jgi:hypothetical protein
MHKLNILYLALATAAPLVAQSNTSVIQGSVIDAATKRPVPGATVSAIRGGLPPLTASARTTLAGSFTISSLPAGVYTLCAQVPGAAYLPSCSWGPTASTVTLASGQKSTANTLRLTPGSVLSVRIQDPAGLTSQKLPNGNAPHLAIGVTGAGGVIIPARLHLRDKNGATWQVVVPFDTNLKLSVFSANLKLVDSSGGALPPAGAAQNFIHGSAASDEPSFTYTVTGRLP